MPQILFIAAVTHYILYNKLIQKIWLIVHALHAAHIVLNCIYHPRKLALSRFTIWRFFVFSVLLRLAEQRLLLQPYFSAAFIVVLIDLFIFRWLIRCNFWTLVNPALNFQPTLPSQYFVMGEIKKPNYYVLYTEQGKTYKFS